MKKLSHSEVITLAHFLAFRVQKAFRGKDNIKMYAIPRGGVPVAYALQSRFKSNKAILLVEDPATADVFIDDIIDTGSTMQKWCDAYPGIPFFALIDKTESNSVWKDVWVVFPWESDEKSEDDSIVGTLTNRVRSMGIPFFANDNISEAIGDGDLIALQAELERRAKHFLQGLIIDIDADHNTAETAKRLAKMYLTEVFKGRYTGQPRITSFPNAKQLDDMYISGPITIRSTCSHHLVPIIGRCWIGIVPGETVVGLSKFNRIVDWIASRPQIQEELVVQIADFLENTLKPRGIAVVIEATHMCMTWRGVKEPMDAVMTTNVVRGVFGESTAARAEFMSTITRK